VRPARERLLAEDYPILPVFLLARARGGKARSELSRALE